MDKPIKLAGFSAARPLARQLIASKPTGMVNMEQVPMLAVFVLENTTLDFVGSRHVPQLRLEGSLDRLIPQNPQEMPYRIGEIGLSEEESIRVVGDYPFTTDQLTALVEKGLYLEGFGPAEDWAGLSFEVDTHIDLRILPPNQVGAPPLTIVDLSPLHFIDMRLETSRYNLADHFPDYRGSLIEAGKITGDEALGVDPTHTQGRGDLSGFSFGGSGRDEADLTSVTGPGGKSRIKWLSSLMGVELAGPSALRGMREELGRNQIRAERARAILRSPGLEELYGEVGATPNPASVTPTLDDNELSRAAEQLESVDLNDLDLSGFSFGGEETTPVAIGPVEVDETDETSLPSVRPATQDPIVAAVIAENEDEGFSFGDREDDDPAVRARKNAQRARQAAARQALQIQQRNATQHHLPEGNAAPAADINGPQLGD